LERHKSREDGQVGKKVSALLVYERSAALAGVEKLLEQLDVKTFRARSCEEARAWLLRPDVPPLVFTDLVFHDGTWEDLLAMIRYGLSNPVPILVSDVVDVRVYSEAIQRGAFDFLVPPFTLPELAYVVRSALEHQASAKASCRDKLEEKLQV
jgi:DNA-binding NtrC family response regulator